jgi:hypothetical protein
MVTVRGGDPHVIDARETTGTPCITTLPLSVPEGWLTLTGTELDDWQRRVMLAWGIQVVPAP